MNSIGKATVAGVLLSLAARMLCAPHARPATSYSYFSMSLPSRHPVVSHTPPAVPILVMHDAVAHASHARDDEEHADEYQTGVDSHPKYGFKYGVADYHTGDHKDAKEERDGDVVKGEYSLLQPDGRKRIVHYTSSKHGGFNAIVSYIGHAIHPEQWVHPSDTNED